MRDGTPGTSSRFAARPDARQFPGPRFPLYLNGAKLQAIYPMGPVMEGAGLNVTVFSYLDSVDFGFLVDSELVPDVWELARATKDAFDELYAASVTSSVS